MPHLSIEIPFENHVRLNELLPHGFKSPIFNIIVEDFIEHMGKMNPKQREKFLGAIAMRMLPLKDYSSLFESKHGRKKHKD